MAIDDRAAARIRANRERMRQGRTTAVALVFQQVGGTHTAVRAAIVLKQQALTLPQTDDRSGLAVSEYLAEFDLTIDPRTVAYVALTADGATDDASLAAAPHLEVLSSHQAGLVPNRYQVTLRSMQ